MRILFATLIALGLLSAPVSSATYQELAGVLENNTLSGKLRIAVVIKAHSILQEASPSAARVQWASEALVNPGAKIAQVLNYLVAANNAAAITAITAATDAVIQTNVDSAIDELHP